ncbi:MAG: tRNA lysidine(34) synthetase TilS [Candidatus Lambdaproteobacteria bacterium RIFOXYD1_FULL_56_27]|uniref:tRNA(Ile)-lysidine synthase n=1 Tax=Candidatus Lambdaproteobacteria bacterium RIFOXYD2_FULL_56_26 TaxID=1817773 RepID=A0A1F6GV51_9PROT|nr:MAG: tRNA lysidine(34) synthetase TilS [Candidatus Lambdaproteobacteria bacterium RIFOXYD2_FULL_56_26]OGH02300.1 MAG: tRNA lysidine(34) synthetase TilS [Candidatus Lambdaproteobacteria bacterium RIFOXYC1_FULL_56_13]OGH10070.1 MAG: tRNA lysidine(34) synthetase TilS [Candidatus Lambdaproteobacteria bacterium RIFOXYD1_FULL_56_27]
MDPLAYQLYKDLTQTGLLPPGQRVLVSWSGGPDSTALVRICQEWQKTLDWELTLVHFNHQIRPESEEEESFCRETAKNLNLPLEVYYPAAPFESTGVQGASRLWRRRVLLERAAEMQCSKIALGHQQNDLAETLLWRMLRGTSLFGLCGLTLLEEPWFRPLLGLARGDLLAYLNRIGQDWREDPSNESDDYLRNRIRRQLIPLMSELAGTSAVDKLAKLAGEAEDLQIWFDQTFDPSLWTSPTLDYQSLAGLVPLFALELIHRFLLHKGCREIGHRQLEEIFKLAQSGKGGWRIDLKDGLMVEGRAHLIRVEVAG